MTSEKNSYFKKAGLSLSSNTEGHSDKYNKIRGRDGLLSKGEEFGYVDQNQKIRKKDGLILKGREVGKVKNRKAYGKDGILFSGQQFGYIDDSGNIRQKDGLFFKGRIIGKLKGNNTEAALGFYVLKFDRFLEKVEKAERELKSDNEKGKYTNKIDKLLELAMRLDALGDFDKLIKKIKALKSEISQHLEGNLRRKEVICSKASSLASSTDWKITAQKLKQLDAEWKSIGQVPKDKQDAIWNKYKNAKQKFFDARSKYFEKREAELEANLRKKEAICV